MLFKFSATTWPKREMYVYTQGFIFIQHYVVKLEFKRIKNENITMYQVILHLRFFNVFLSQCKNVHIQCR